MILCEIRVPTYRRPQWLERALRSILAQDIRHWRAIVFDDSPDREGRQVVQRLGDGRIEYRANPSSLGAAGNIDQCFYSRPLIGGTHACILEDDNWFYPGFLSSNLKALQESKMAICLRNQAVWRQFASRAEPTHTTTLGDYYRDGIYRPEQLCARLLFAYGISQGGLFWSLRDNVPSLMVGPTVRDSGLSETCRTLRIARPVVFRSQPQCAWAEMDESLCVRSFLPKRIYGRALQSIRRFAVRTHGRSMIAEAASLAESLGCRSRLDQNLIDSFLDPLPAEWDLGRALLRLAKSAMKSLIVPNQVSAFLYELDRAARDTISSDSASYRPADALAYPG